MDLIKNYLQQTQKPDGLLGSLMISSMNRHHAKLADWGMSHLVNISPDTIEELGCGGGRNVKALLKKYPDAKISALDYSSTGQCSKTSLFIRKHGPCNCL